MEISDQVLVADAKKDPRAFAALYKKYALKVYNYFWYRLRQDAVVAEDFTQETFMRAFEHLPNFRSRGYSYLTYLLTIAHNILVNHYRRQSTLSLEALTDAENIPEEIKEDTSNKDVAEAVWRAIQELPPQDKDIMLLRHHKGLSVREIAHVLGKTENAVKLSLSRIQRKLRRQFDLNAIAKLGQHKARLKPLPFLK